MHHLYQRYQRQDACWCQRQTPTVTYFTRSITSIAVTSGQSKLPLFIAPLETDSKFVHSALPTAVCIVNKRRQAELCVALAICFQIANRWTRWRCSYQGLSQDEGWAYFSESPPLLYVIKTFRMNILSARSISLDNTFKLHT